METDFGSFIVLLVISVIVSAILHYGFKYYVTPGTASFLSKIVVGYIGGWLSPWVLGLWFPAVAVAEVDIISAIVGTTAMLVVAVDLAKMLTAKGAAAGP